MSNGVRYEIRNVWDFRKVPDDRLDLCLREFGVAVRMARATVGLLDAVAEQLSAPTGLFAIGETFTWIDDDKREANITIHTPPPETPAVQSSDDTTERK